MYFLNKKMACYLNTAVHTMLQFYTLTYLKWFYKSNENERVSHMSLRDKIGDKYTEFMLPR